MRLRMILLAAAAAVTLTMTGARAQPESAAGLPPVKALTMLAAAMPSSDLDKSIAFYTKGLGMTLAGRVEMATVVEAPLTFPGSGAYLMLQHPKTAGAVLPARGALNRVILAVPDLKSLAAQLGAAGYPVTVRENAQYHVAVAMVEDPDGNHIELVQRMP
jgi:catechol 2,3-dioxygenase-like lactoylglutathione lyase family enzyme